MENLRQDFAEQTLRKLDILIEDLRAETENYSENFRREAFRALHTIKGTGQTIGFTASGDLAHELENLLAAAGDRRKNSDVTSSGESKKTLLLDGLQILKKTLEQPDYKIPAAFFERIGARAAGETVEPQTNESELPDEIFSQLTNAEKRALASAAPNEKRIFCLEIHFDSATFGDEFVAFRQTLCEKCEIIATLPAQSAGGAANEIGFRFLIATAAADIIETLEKSRAEIVFQSPPPRSIESTNRLENVFASIVAHGESVAKRLNKQIRFQIAAAEIEEISPPTLQIVFDALAHLVRNAVDHAIETPAERRAKNKRARGTIKIDFAARENEFYLSVEDDGRGVDFKKIKAEAVEKKLISGGDNLSERRALDLIFLSEFSTRGGDVTNVSGRGVGLDAVKSAVEKAGGKITVESEPDARTAFEIFLPRES